MGKKKEQDQIMFNNEPSQEFEIVVQVRDNLGNATGQTRSFSHNDGFKISEFYNKNTPYVWDGEGYKLKGGRKKGHKSKKVPKKEKE